MREGRTACMDPHIRAFREDDQLYEDFPGDTMRPPESFGEDMGTSMRISRLYQSLEEKGDYATLDKAKRNEHFREFLLTNFEEQEYGHDYR